MFAAAQLPERLAVLLTRLVAHPDLPVARLVGAD